MYSCLNLKKWGGKSGHVVFPFFSFLFFLVLKKSIMSFKICHVTVTSLMGVVIADATNSRQLKKGANVEVKKKSAAPFFILNWYCRGFTWSFSVLSFASVSPLGWASLYRCWAVKSSNLLTLSLADTKTWTPCRLAQIEVTLKTAPPCDL